MRLRGLPVLSLPCSEILRVGSRYSSGDSLMSLLSRIQVPDCVLVFSLCPCFWPPDPVVSLAVQSSTLVIPAGAGGLGADSPA